MGVALYIQGYKKNENCISGKLRSIGWYEVDINKIENYKIEDTSMVVHEEFDSFKEIMSIDYAGELGFHHFGGLSFFFNIMNGISGYGYYVDSEGSEYGLMFDAIKLLPVIESVSNIADRLPSVRAEEFRNLLELIKLLKVVAGKDGIVGMSIG